MIEFDYRQERLRSGEIIFRPVANIYILRNNKEWISENFYIDSGADYTMISYRMGIFLGLEKIALDVKQMGGIGGAITARFAIVPMRIEKHQFNCTIAWAQIEQVPLLLGRKNVFDNFDIKFQQRKKKTAFEWQKS
ncbi:MAG: hypothetical protein FVQ77_01805 [Cytophagales bacterium]|nr:hypothetical protein [Cytophagales bacterium]